MHCACIHTGVLIPLAAVLSVAVSVVLVVLAVHAPEYRSS
jgi:hypothetical protein